MADLVAHEVRKFNVFHRDVARNSVDIDFKNSTRNESFSLIFLRNRNWFNLPHAFSKFFEEDMWIGREILGKDELPGNAECGTENKFGQKQTDI